MEDSYENALREQMDNLRVGFLTQIANAQEINRESKRIKVIYLINSKGKSTI
jgi:hypothetical protein